ncbi:MAG: hypothetical protein J0L93_00150 [Deltaproteobacteria bacterium]|nr:hypothetical protein [Deltaproteobacteria bacterium]
MKLTLTFRLGLVVYFIGFIFSYFYWGFEGFLWFAVGGGLALMNMYYAIWAVQRGLGGGAKSGGVFLMLLLFKSLTFVLLVGMILVLLKPLLLPFTLGLGVVIFASIGAAFWESRRYIKRQNNVS